jgi:hypothetical protein
MKYYTRREIQMLLEIDDRLWVALESEEIVTDDAPEPERYSELMLERARVASNLVNDLDVNLPGAAIIVRLREELSDMRHDMERLLEEFGRSRTR